MRILILGEGPTDLGRFDKEGNLEQEGMLPILVRELLLEQDADLSLEFRVKTLASTMLIKKPSQKTKTSRYGLSNKLQAVQGLPLGKWAEAIVAVVDRDEKKYDKRIEDLNEGRDFLLQQGKRCAVGMAIEEIEAWLLADEKALRIALDDNSIKRQPAPEKLASRDDKSLKNPKGLLAHVMKGSMQREVSADEFPELCARIAEEIDLAQLEKRCPKGFQPFAEQVRQMGKG